MRRAADCIDPAEIAELLAIVAGARAHRPQLDHLEEAKLLLQLLDERRIRLTAAAWKRRRTAPIDGGLLTGEEVRNARSDLQMSKQELAKRAGLYHGTLTRFENGTRGASAASTARALTKAIAAARQERGGS